MPDNKIIAANGKDYSVTLKRFDHYTEPGGPSYHGHYVTIEGYGLTVSARKYDGESEISIQSGIGETDLEAIETVKDIARQMFGIDRLMLLTRDNQTPYKAI